MKTPRPKELDSKTVRIKTYCGNMYVTVSEHEGNPFEIFATLGKAGGCMNANMEALTRAITTGLRYGVPLQEYIDELKDIRCPTPVMFPEEDRVLSCADAIAKVLAGDGWVRKSRKEVNTDGKG